MSFCRPTRAASCSASPPLLGVRPLVLVTHLTLLGSAFAVVSWSPSALAQNAVTVSTTRSYHIPPGSLSSVLTRFSREAGVFLVSAASTVENNNSPGLIGTYSVLAGFTALLVGTSLEAFQLADGSYGLRPAAAGPVASITTGDSNGGTLPVVRVVASIETLFGEPSKPYVGGQVARGARLGILGERNIMNTPFSATSYTSELIRNQQANSIANVLVNDASVRTVNEGSASVAGTGDEFQIRGFPVRNQDVSLNGLYGMLPLRSISLDGVERVEVLKGPNAMLNGISPRGSVGGGINVVPKRATEEPLTRVTTLYESDLRFGTAIDIGRRFGENNEWGIRLNGAYRNGNTAVRNQSSELGNAVVGLDYRSADMRVSLDAGHQTSNIDAPGDSGILIFNPLLPVPKAPKASRGYSPDWGYANSKDNYGIMRAEYDIKPNLSVFGGLGWRRSENSYLYADPIILGPNGATVMRPYYWPSWEQNTSIMLGARGSFETGTVTHEATLSYSTFRQRAGYRDYYVFGLYPSDLHDPVNLPKPDLAGLSSKPPVTSRLELPTWSLSDTLSFANDQIQLTAGVRYQTVKSHNYSYTTGEEASAYDKSALTPAFGLIVKPWQNVSLYANYIQGLSTGPTAPTGTVNAGQTFAPIKTEQVEAGMKVDFGSVTTTLGLFEIKQPSGMTVANANGNGLRYEVTGEQRNRGVEFNAYGELAKGLRVLGGVTYMQSVMTRTNSAATHEKAAIGVPRWMANFGLEYPAFTRGLFLSIRTLSTSWQHQDIENSRRIPGWTRWDIGARYATRAFDHPVTLRVNVNNLFGKNYWSSASEGYLRLGAPRSVLFSTTIDF